MLCEHCKLNIATVHITGRSVVGAASSETTKPFEHHYCEGCAKELEQTDARLNPMLSASPGARRWKFQVIGISGERVTVREIQPDDRATGNEMSFLIARLPQNYAVLGTEFEVI